MNELRGKVAVITGAANGIGRAMALRAADEGMKVVGADRDAAGLERLGAELAARGAEPMTVVVDVTDPAAVEALAEKTFARFGATHLLANNAGIAVAAAAWETPLVEWERVLAVNLNGVIHGIAAFVPRMIASGEPGHVVNVASAAGLVSAPCLAAYNASKFAVVGLSEALFHDLRLRKTKLSVSVVCPSWVQTAIAGRVPEEPPPGVHPVTFKVQCAIAEAVRTGISPESVVEQVFDAVVNDRFYVLTHDVIRAGVKVRSDDILQGRPPTFMPVQPNERPAS